MPMRTRVIGRSRVSWLAIAVLFALACILIPRPAPAQTAVTPDDTLSSVLVIPNPYSVTARTWGPPSEVKGFERLRFTNLPKSPCDVYVLTSQGNHVITLPHPGGNRDLLWDGRNANNQYIVSDVYLFVVDSPTLGQHLGKFVVIR